MLVFACFSPHPPILLPEVGSPADRAKVAKTIKALEGLGTELAEVKPEVIIISSPHPDWGINVPLHFLLMANGKWQMVKNLETIRHTPYAIYPIITTLDSPRQHYEWGKQIAQDLPPAKRVTWVASGDMSHRLRKDGPYGFHPSGPKFDQKFIELFKKKDIEGILNLDPNLAEEAGECGLRSFCLLLGALEWQSSSAGLKPSSAWQPSSAGLKPSSAWQPQVLSYEGPFGVGYLVANLKIKS